MGKTSRRETVFRLTVHDHSEIGKSSSGISLSFNKSLTSSHYSVYIAAVPRKVVLQFLVRMIVPLAFVVAAMSVSACAAPLLPEISLAQRAIAVAKEAKADQYASELLGDAAASLNEGMLLRGGQRRDAAELLLRARLQAEVAAALAKERAVAEQLQATRDRSGDAKSKADAARQVADAAKSELGKPIVSSPVTPAPPPSLFSP